MGGERTQIGQITNWPTTVEADGYMKANYILLTTSVYAEFFHNKKVFSKEKKIQRKYNFMVPRKYMNYKTSFLSPHPTP